MIQIWCEKHLDFDIFASLQAHAVHSAQVAHTLQKIRRPVVGVVTLGSMLEND